MGDFPLRFCLDRGRYDGKLIDLLNEEEDEAQLPPETGGAYVLGTSATMLTYPWGISPVFFIGKATNLRDRVTRHKGRIQKARDNYDAYWPPQIQYGAAFGAHVAWFFRRGQEDPRKREASLIAKFYETCGAMPTANGVWPRRIAGSLDADHVPGHDGYGR